MAESLWRIAQLFAADGDLFRKHSEMISEAKHVFEQADGSVEVLGVVHAGAGECLDEPECAHAEGAFAAADP